MLALDWPRLHHIAAIEREKSAPASKTTKGVDFVCPAKEWEELKVYQRPPERGLSIVYTKLGWSCLAFPLARTLLNHAALGGQEM